MHWKLWGRGKVVSLGKWGFGVDREGRKGEEV